MLPLLQFSPVVERSIVGGVGLLVFATAVSLFLRARAPENLTFQKVVVIIQGWWIIVTFLVAALALGHTGVTILFLVLSLMALKEYLNVANLKVFGTPHIVAVVALTFVHYYFVLAEVKNFFFSILPIVTFIFLPMLFLAERKITNLLSSLWATQSAAMLCIYFLSFVPGLAFLNHHPAPLRLIDPVAAFIYLFLLTQLNDVFQFLCGKAFGRHKLIPEISPNKTVEGFVGGVILTIALSLVLAPMYLDLTMKQSLIMGYCLAISGISGDLMFSTVKRSYGVKDFSDFIPGHGGILDRVDSLIFTAPTFYGLLYFFIH